MRLIKCHIENFGKLHNTDIDFEEGFNLFCQDNGWGKSTLAAFIRVMLYGFEGETKRSSLENERKRFEPWQGGIYGGSLTFEVQGKEYVVTRVFKEKAANDVFELRDGKTNLETHDFSTNIGEDIFKINSEAFLRTSFIRQQDCVTGTNDSINAKIGNLSENSNDLNSFETADEALKDLLNKMSPRVKKGSLHQMQEEITHLKKQVSDGVALEEAMEKLQVYYRGALAQFEEIKNKKQEITKEQENTSRYQDILAKKDAYELLCKEAEEKEALLQGILESFKNGVPTEQDVKDALELCALMERMAGEEKFSRLTGEEEAVFEQLDAAFSKGIPEKESLTKALIRAQEMDEQVEMQAQYRLSKEEEEQYLADKEFFGTENPIQEINRLQQQWNERGVLKSTISMQQSGVDMMKRQQMAEETAEKQKAGQRRTFAVIMMIMGAAGAGVGAYFTKVPLLVAGVVILIAGLIVLIIGKNKKYPEQIDSSLEQELAESRRKVEEIQRMTEEYLTQHNYIYGEDSVLTQLQQLLNRALIYENLSEKYKKYRNAGAFSKGLENAEELEQFLVPYARLLTEDLDWTQKVQKVIKAGEQFLAFKEKLEKNKNARAGYSDARYGVLRFLTKFGFEPVEETLLRNQLQHMLEDVTIHKARLESFSQAKKKKEAYEQQYNMEEISMLSADGEAVSLQELQERYALLEAEGEQLRAGIKTYEEQLYGLQEKYDEWNVTKVVLEEKEEEFRQKKQQYGLLEKTREYLGKAKEALTARYTGPIMEHFVKYYGIVSGSEPSGYHMDANIQVTLEEQGLQRDVAFLSTGYQDLIGVCLRLALVEAMYTGEKPMLIMDDPFVNLDETKTRGSKRLLDELAKHYQILYFTCK